MGTSTQRFAYALLTACLFVLSCVLIACGSDSNTSSNASSAYASSGNTSKQAVTVKESKGADGKDAYAFDPASITVNKGDSITIQNQSDELQDIDEGDASKAGVDAKVPVNGSANVTFNNAGTFTRFCQN